MEPAAAALVGLIVPQTVERGDATAAAWANSRSTLAVQVLNDCANPRQRPRCRSRFGVSKASSFLDQKRHFILLADSCPFGSDARPDATGIAAWHRSRRDWSSRGLSEGGGAGP